MVYRSVLDVFVLHAGLAPEISQATLTVMLVVLGITLMGIGFGRLSKTKTSLAQHRWILRAAVV